MRIIKKIFFILITVITTIFNQSCGSSEIKDDTLSSFMLGGIYFIKGYGGNDITRSMIRESGYISNKEIIKGYKELFEFPFTISQKSNISSFLEERWEINDQASLLKTIELLKTQDSEHKAWDYALLVNNVAMGYAAEYITKEEGISIVKEILPLAREKYTSWEDYYTDYNLGRKEWDSEGSEDAAIYDDLSRSITKGDDSIYQILPLH